MTVEEIRVENGHYYEQFPMGLRVLAVDDDPTCLILLESLLRKCHYNVTTTSQARTALEMLRENKDGFDLVIIDVHMPDMDGFRLLELVGLEMDLPVIMLSANSDPKSVMIGVNHGACDYLVKPVRLEELRNIFQHVVRKRKVDPNNPKRPTGQNQAHESNGEGRGPPLPDQNEKFIRKRKDEEDDSEDNRNKSDPVKKPRVVWSMELHTKFVAAASQLGFDKAVPKKILELMKDDSLTRENVASHLQKFRLYLKRISLDPATQHAAMLGSPLMRTAPLNGPGDYRALTGPGPFRNVPLSPFTTGAGFGRLNSPSSVNLGNRAPSSLVQPSQPQNFINSIPTLGKTHPSNQNLCLFQGVQSGFEQQNKGVSGIPSFNTGTGIGCSSNLLSGSFNVGISGSSNLQDPGRCNDSWQNSIESSNKMLPTEPFHSQLPKDNNSVNGPYLQNNPFENLIEGVNGHFHNMNSGRWGEVQRQNYPEGSTNTFGSHNPANGIVTPLDHNSGLDMFVDNGKSSEWASSLLQQNENEKSQGGFVSQSSDPLDELANAIIIPVQDDMRHCDFEFGDLAFGPAI